MFRSAVCTCGARASCGGSRTRRSAGSGRGRGSTARVRLSGSKGFLLAPTGPLPDVDLGLMIRPTWGPHG